VAEGENPNAPAEAGASDVVDVAPVPLLRPRDGTPAPVNTPDALAAAIEALGAGTGPVALDAERASGYRYTQRAYLIQLRREGAGTYLIDPLPFDGLAELGATLADTEWVLHAANQDLSCLADEGMRPKELFDTELAGRLAGFERVGLATIVERMLGFRLEKTHSAADWSTRPLPTDWLTYAALDVEVLVDLRDALEEVLRQQGKLDWALEEFAALTTWEPAPPRAEPWRRTSGVHKVRSPRGLGRVRELWLARDRMAADRDIAPGRVLPDSAIVSAAIADPANSRALTALPVFSGRANRRLADTWMAALLAARALPTDELPAVSAPTDGPPPPNRWADRDPVAAARLAAARAAMQELSAEYDIPTENLLAPDYVRRLAWSPPETISTEVLRTILLDGGARRWQVELTAAPLAEALSSIES
jgi:ribonuclease D